MRHNVRGRGKIALPQRGFALLAQVGLFELTSIHLAQPNSRSNRLASEHH